MEPLVSVPLTCSLLFPSDSNAPSVNTVSPGRGAQGPGAQCAFLARGPPHLFSECFHSVVTRAASVTYSTQPKAALDVSYTPSGASYNPTAISLTQIVRRQGWDDS